MVTPPTLSAAMGGAGSADLDLDGVLEDLVALDAADRAALDPDRPADAARDLASTRSAARAIAEANK
jgi:hypothetical protein